MVRVVAALADSTFRDFRFLEPSGVLKLKPQTPDVIRVRLELPSVEPLHLASVLLSGDGLDDPASVTERTASSSWGRYGELLGQGLLFDRDNRKTAFHTKREPRPWLELSFTRPVRLDRIVLRNRPDMLSVRARGIQVLVQTVDGTWATVYDGIAREREFVAAAERAYAGLIRGTGSGSIIGDRAGALTRRLLRRGSPEPSPTVGRLGGLARVLAAIVIRDYQGIIRDVDRLGLTADEASDLRTMVNQRLLSGRELEWTSHGIRRSFRFWSQKEQRNYVGFAVGVIDALRAVNENVCLGFGSVLSVVRDHELMPHDDDLDIIIGFEREQAPTLAAANALVTRELSARGYSVTGRMTAHRWVSRRGHPHKVDVFVGLFEGDTISWYPGKRGALTREMMFPPESRPFLGHECRVPRRSEEYLEQVYGPGWRVPDVNFRHSWVGSDYLDIAR